MQVISVISTKGGVGKTTIAANLGGFIADAGLRVLLLDLDAQPTLSSYYELVQRAPGGIYELLAFNESDLSNLVSRTAVNGLDVLISNDAHRQLGTLPFAARPLQSTFRGSTPFERRWPGQALSSASARSPLAGMGDPAFPIVTSPECFKQNALGVLLPRDVIPVIFVPGIMGTNLAVKGDDGEVGEAAREPPNGVGEALGTVYAPDA